MTEETKNIEETKCKCCECKEKLKEFAFKTAIVYVGVTLAIITSANILKPKHQPCPFGRPQARMERPIPPSAAQDIERLKSYKILGHKHRRHLVAPTQGQQIKHPVQKAPKH